MERVNLVRAGVPGRDVADDHVLFSESAPFGDMGSPLNLLIEAIPHAIFVLEEQANETVQWKLVAINSLHNELSGLGPQQGHLISEWCPPELLDTLNHNYNHAISLWDQISYEEELELLRGRKWWSTTLMPLRTPSGRRRILGSSRDISHVKQAETALSKFLPICSVCKSVKVSDGPTSRDAGWIPIETYLRDVQLTHGYCPDCFDRLYGYLKADRE